MYTLSGPNKNITANKNQKSKKKARRNAFSFFIDDKMIELRRLGRTVTSKAEVVHLVSDEWKVMSADQKAPYELKAKQMKMNNQQQVRPGRLDCTGQSMDSRVNLDAQNDWLRKEKRKAIRSSWPNGIDVCNEHFYIISFQSLFELPYEEGYQPCEVACIDYTLNDGIINVWHQFIDHGPIKLGLHGEVKIFTERTHQIPVHFEAAISDYEFLWHQLLKFVKYNARDQQYPTLYTRICEMKKTKFCLEWLSAKAGMTNQLQNVCEFEDIAAELYPHAGLTRPSVSFINDGCGTSIFDFESNAKCDYHDELENIHCAVLTVKKCCYWMSDAFQQVYGYEITDQHLPIKSSPCYTVTYPDQFFVDDRKQQLSKKIKNDPFLMGNDDKMSNNMEKVKSDNIASGSSLFNPRDTRCKTTYKLIPFNPCTLRESEIAPILPKNSSSTGPTLKNDAILLQHGAATEKIVRRPTIPSKIASNKKILAANFNIKVPENKHTSFSESDFPSLSATYGSGSNSISSIEKSLNLGFNNLTFGNVDVRLQKEN